MATPTSKTPTANMSLGGQPQSQNYTMATSQSIPYQYTDAAQQGGSSVAQKPQKSQAQINLENAQRANQGVQTQGAQTPQVTPPVAAGGVGGAGGTSGVSGIRGTGTGFTPSPLGQMGGGGYLYNPETGGFQRTGAQKGTNAGEALKALQSSSGLNLLGSFNADGSGAGGPGGPGGPVPHVGPADPTAANAAAFARAKDQAGETARGALTGLTSQLGAHGQLGSGAGARATGGIVNRAAQGSNEITREQAIQGVDTNNRFAETNYQGDITQRGQDLAAQEAAANRSAQLRAQQMQGLLSVINSSGLLY